MRIVSRLSDLYCNWRRTAWSKSLKTLKVLPVSIKQNTRVYECAAKSLIIPISTMILWCVPGTCIYFKLCPVDVAFFAPAVNLNIYVVLNRQKFIFCIFTALHLSPLLVKLIKPEPNGQGAYIACNFNFVMKTQCSFQNCTCSYISTTSVEASCYKTESFIECVGVGMG